MSGNLWTGVNIGLRRTLYINLNAFVSGVSVSGVQGVRSLLIGGGYKLFQRPYINVYASVSVSGGPESEVQGVRKLLDGGLHRLYTEPFFKLVAFVGGCQGLGLQVVIKIMNVSFILNYV